MSVPGYCPMVNGKHIGNFINNIVTIPGEILEHINVGNATNARFRLADGREITVASIRPEILTAGKCVMLSVKVESAVQVSLISDAPITPIDDIAHMKLYNATIDRTFDPALKAYFHEQTN